jgi:hypothetical protein
MAQVKRSSQALCLLTWMCSVSVFAQDLTPRAYWPAPKGTKLLLLGYANQSGDIVTDPTLPITGVDSTIHSGVIAYQQTVDLFGRTSNFQLELPYVDGKTSGFAFGESARRDVQGIGDISAVSSINLLGAPSMNGEGFQELRQNPRPILGASIKIVAPTGEYDADKLINVGSNRWAVRARLGYTQPLSAKWLMEVAVGAWFFEDNDEFLGETRKQEPITALDFSLIRRFRPGLWGSLDLNHYRGGRTTVSGFPGADLQRNSRAGITLVYPIKSRHAIKVSVSSGVATESGGDYRIASVSYLRLID